MEEIADRAGVAVGTLYNYFRSKDELLLAIPFFLLAFGGGVHRCLGSHLARVELRVALREFHRRIPDYTLKPGTVLQYTPGLRSLTTLPIEFRPAG